MQKLPFLPLLIALLAFAAPVRAEGLSQTLPVAGPGRLVIELDRGAVEVVTHADANVRVDAEAHGLGASSVHFEIVRDGNDIVLRARSEAWIEWLSTGPRLRVHAWIPASFEVVSASDRALVTRRDAFEISHPARRSGDAIH